MGRGLTIQVARLSFIYIGGLVMFISVISLYISIHGILEKQFPSKIWPIEYTTLSRVTHGSSAIFLNVIVYSAACF